MGHPSEDDTGRTWLKRISWNQILRSPRTRWLLAGLLVLWALTGMLAHSEGIRARLEDFTTKRVKPALEAVDPWFVLGRVWTYTGPNCDLLDRLDATRTRSHKCDDGVGLRAARLPAAIWRVAGDVHASGWPATVSAVLSLLVGITALTPSGGDPWPWWSPFTYLQVLALAGGFAWLLKFVFGELFSLFGW